jgi:HD superfamily phosphohydrolases
MGKDKIIRDIVQGYINVDKNVLDVIDHPSFQRLKHISQLTAQSLYPSANHTRFEHSIGVMNLAIRYYSSIKDRLLELGVTEVQYNNYMFNLKYSSLLHDVGHAPLSHIGEQFYDIEEINIEINKLIPESSLWIKNGSPHEKMSCYVIARNFHEILKNIFTSELRELDIELIFRSISGTKYDHNWEKNIVIEILNSNSIDVDKLDYLIRDNFMVGNLAPAFDLDRFLQSITIDEIKKICYKSSGLSSIIRVIDCRDFLYIWLYNHHTLVYTDYLYETEIEHLLKWEKDDKSPYNINNYISCKAIAENYLSDTDIHSWLNREYQSHNSKYSDTILKQIINRAYLKPLWKSIFEYKTFMQNNFNDREQKEILKIITGGKTKEELDKKDTKRREIVKLIRNECNIDPGNLFIIERSNKFYSSSQAEFFVNVSGREIDLKELIPMRQFNETLSNVAFYIFVPNDKIQQVKSCFVKSIKSLITT